MGRPSKLTKDIRTVILRCARLGKIDSQICDIIDIDPQTLSNWKKKDPEFFASLKAAKELADLEVVDSLLKLATGECVTTEIHTGADATGNIIDKKVVKEHKADIGAIRTWLHNRDPNRWKDKINHDVNIDAEKLELNFKIVSTEDE